MEVVEPIIRYLLLPLATIICTVLWRMYTKLEKRMDSIENRTQITEKELIEIKIATRKDIEYIKESIDDIKEILVNNKHG